MAQGDTRLAVQQLQKAVELDPRLALPHLVLALIEFNQGHLDRSDAWCDSFLKLDPRSRLASEAHSLKRQVADAKSLGLSAKAADAMRYEAMLDEAHEAARQRRADRLIQLGRESVIFAPQRWEVAAYAGAELLRDERFEAARPLLAWALKVAPASKRVPLETALETAERETKYRSNLAKGRRHYLAGDYQKAAEFLLAAENLHPESSDGVVELVEALGATGEWDLAKRVAARHEADARFSEADRRALAQTRRMASLQMGAHQPTVSVPAAPEMTDFGQVVASLNEDIRKVEAQQSRFEQEAAERGRRLRAEIGRIQRGIDESERTIQSLHSTIRQSWDAVARFQRDAANYRSQPNGGIAAALAEASAGGFRIAAEAQQRSLEEETQKLPRLREELNQKQAEMPDEAIASRMANRSRASESGGEDFNEEGSEGESPNSEDEFGSGATKTIADAQACADRCQQMQRNDPYFRACNDGSMRGCYCAAVAVSQCFIDQRCYKEAGMPTATTRAMLQRQVDENNRNACSLNGCCR